MEYHKAEVTAVTEKFKTIVLFLLSNYSETFERAIFWIIVAHLICVGNLDLLTALISLVATFCGVFAHPLVAVSTRYIPEDSAYFSYLLKVLISELSISSLLLLLLVSITSGLSQDTFLLYTGVFLYIFSTFDIFLTGIVESFFRIKLILKSQIIAILSKYIFLISILFIMKMNNSYYDVLFITCLLVYRITKVIYYVLNLRNSISVGKSYRLRIPFKEILIAYLSNISISFSRLLCLHITPYLAFVIFNTEKGISASLYFSINIMLLLAMLPASIVNILLPMSVKERKNYIDVVYIPLMLISTMLGSLCILMARYILLFIKPQLMNTCYYFSLMLVNLSLWVHSSILVCKLNLFKKYRTILLASILQTLTFVLILYLTLDFYGPISIIISLFTSLLSFIMVSENTRKKIIISLVMSSILLTSLYASFTMSTIEKVLYFTIMFLIMIYITYTLIRRVKKSLV